MSMHSTPPPLGAPMAPRKNWWGRNWFWVVPTGCLTMILGVAAFVVSILVIVFGALRSAEPYQHAVTAARGNPEVLAALGTPIKEGLFMSGSINVTGASGKADIAIPISGPKGKGKIYVDATKSVGRWNYAQLVVEVTGTGRRINLVGGEVQDEALEREPANQL